MEFLEHATEAIEAVLGDRSSLLFVPFASSDPDTYTSIMRQALARVESRSTSLDQARNLTAAAADAQAVFVGGGNWFRLLHALTTARRAGGAAARGGGGCAVPGLPVPARTWPARPSAPPTTCRSSSRARWRRWADPIPAQPPLSGPGSAQPHQGETRRQGSRSSWRRTTSQCWACAKAAGCRFWRAGNTVGQQHRPPVPPAHRPHRHPSRRGPVLAARHLPSLCIGTQPSAATGNVRLAGGHRTILDLLPRRGHAGNACGGGFRCKGDDDE